MEKRDYYEILGVSRDASDSELKSAYRKLSMQFHPDRQAGKSDAEKKEAEEKFKEVSAAYACLSDKEKRAHYDQFGSEDGPQGFSGGFGGFDPFDLFRKMHAGFGMDDDDDSPFGFHHRRRDPEAEINAPEHGSDIQTRINVSFKEAVFGCTKEFDLNLDKECSECHGRGIEDGSKPEECTHCHGTGQQVRTIRQGMFCQQMISLCPHCGGVGVKVKECKHCHGAKRVPDKKHIKVKVPAGINNGQRLRLRDSGHCGIKGGANGTLYINVMVEESSLFERDGNDIYIKMPISMTTATLGGKIDVPTVYGYKKLKIAPETTSGTVMRIAGAGIKTDSSGTGDMYVALVVEPYVNMTSDQKKALEKLQKLETASNFKQAQELLKKADEFYK